MFCCFFFSVAVLVVRLTATPPLPLPLQTVSCLLYDSDWVQLCDTAHEEDLTTFFNNDCSRHVKRSAERKQSRTELREGDKENWNIPITTALQYSTAHVSTALCSKTRSRQQETHVIEVGSKSPCNGEHFSAYPKYCTKQQQTDR